MSFDPVTAAFNVGEKLIDRLWPDPEKADQAKLELFKMEQSGELKRLASDTELAKAQMLINTEEAKHSSLFVSGWRPFIGWVCGGAFAYHFILQPLIVFVLATQGRVIDLPIFDMSSIMTALFGMLGIGTLRTVEKWRGVAK